MAPLLVIAALLAMGAGIVAWFTRKPTQRPARRRPPPASTRTRSPAAEQRAVDPADPFAHAPPVTSPGSADLNSFGVERQP